MDKENKPGEIHEIDGIIELDHPVPRWWQNLFYILIVWSIGYGGWYLFGNGPTLKQELARDLLALEMKRSSGTKPPADEEKELLAAIASPERLARGKAVFGKNCASCHGPDGGGGIGPNLTDTSWIHGDGTPTAILKVVREGVAEKGMPPWGALLKSEETLEVAAHVRSLRGTTPAHPKPAQGQNVAANP
jgi:cytochrome c oxidase cbb3-type subunit 3